MKVKILNQTITLMNSPNYIPYPYIDINYSNNMIFVSNHIDFKKCREGTTK